MNSADLLSNFLEPSSENILENKKKLAPKFGRNLTEEGSEMELLERLSNISSHSNKSKRNLPRPSEMKHSAHDDLLSLIQNTDNGQMHESGDGETQSENIVYDPVDSEDVDEGRFNYFFNFHF